MGGAGAGIAVTRRNLPWPAGAQWRESTVRSVWSTVCREGSSRVQGVSLFWCPPLCCCGALCVSSFRREIPMSGTYDSWAKGFVGKFYGLC